MTQFFLTIFLLVALFWGASKFTTGINDANYGLSNAEYAIAFLTYFGIVGLLSWLLYGHPVICAWVLVGIAAIHLTNHQGRDRRDAINALSIPIILDMILSIAKCLDAKTLAIGLGLLWYILPVALVFIAGQIRVELLKIAGSKVSGKLAEDSEESESSEDTSKAEKIAAQAEEALKAARKRVDKVGQSENSWVFGLLIVVAISVWVIYAII